LTNTKKYYKIKNKYNNEKRNAVMIENKVYTLKVGELDTNCYIMRDVEKGTAVVIDPGADAEKIKNKLQELGVSVSLILLTHGHFDHILGVEELRDEKTTVAIHASDAHSLVERDIYSSMFSYDTRPFRRADVLFDKEGSYELCGFEFDVIHTPGHTDGSLCYIFGNVMFSGDTIFNNSIGRTDLMGGDDHKMYKSLKKLAAIQEDYIIYPGHATSTTLLNEKKNNPFLTQIVL
jgi:glyoxylase-like metal-dependent hydrolase (beta-lactamase superfamily II)